MYTQGKKTFGYIRKSLCCFFCYLMNRYTVIISAEATVYITDVDLLGLYCFCECQIL